MTTVRATCRQCGDIILDVRAVTVARPYYTFTCPHCGQPHIKDAKPFVLAKLVCVGSHIAIAHTIDDDFYQAAVEAELGVAS